MCVEGDRLEISCLLPSIPGSQEEMGCRERLLLENDNSNATCREGEISAGVKVAAGV